MVIVPIPSYAEFGPNDHQEDACVTHPTLFVTFDKKP